MFVLAVRRRSRSAVAAESNLRGLALRQTAKSGVGLRAGRFPASAA